MCKRLISRGFRVASSALRAASVCVAGALAVVPPAPLAAQEGPPSAAAFPSGSEADHIQPGDVIRVTFLREPDLSGEFPVNQFGTVVLPVVGEYDVTGDTNRSFRDRVLSDLRKVRYAPDVELIVLRRVRVLGEVNEPGVYPLDPTLSIADAIAMAKGRTGAADEGRVLLRRGADVLDTDLRLDVRISDSGIRSGDEIFVPRQSWWERNLMAVVAGASTVLGVVVTLFLR